MAQRTGAERFLASLRKAASAGVILALAAALCLSGCGGDSGPETASAPSDAPKGAEGEQGKTTPSSSKNSSSPSSPKTATAGSGEAKSSEPNSGGKRGAPIAIPKGPREKAPTPQELAQTTMASMTLESPAVAPPAVGSTASLPATYTCEGKNASPPLRWAGTPEGTEELVLFAMNLAAVNEALFFDWAVAGLDPELESLPEGSLPKGAVLGRNGFGKEGYSICPQGPGETYIFALHAIPEPTGAKRGFNPLALREEVLAQAANVGILAVSYTR